MGALRNPLLRRAARFVERFVYRRATRLIALSPGIRAGMVAAGAAAERVVLVPNASDLDLFRPAEPPERFRVSYFGTMGEANDLTAAVEAARLLPEVEFLLVGDGKRRAELERAAPPNVRFTGPAGDKEEVAELAAASSACLTLFKDVPVLATCSPNKLFDTFAAGRPAIVNMDGWMRELVDRNGAGVYVRAGDAGDLAEKVTWLRDHASTDGSAEAVRERHPDARLFALDRRTGKADNDSLLLREARGRYCLLLNEDAELRDGAARALLDALEADPRAAAAGAQLLTSEGEPTACAWRLPDIPWALAAAVFLHDRVAVQSTGADVREVGWAQSSALLVRREAAEQIGWLGPDFFVYSDETDFCKRLRDSGWRILFVPAARAVHHDQLASDLPAMTRRIVEFHRNRDRYFRKHGLRLTRLVWRACWVWAYLARAGAAAVLPGRDPRRYL